MKTFAYSVVYTSPTVEGSELSYERGGASKILYAAAYILMALDFSDETGVEVSAHVHTHESMEVVKEV